MQRWIWDKGWSALHPAQEAAVGPVLEGRDVLITAATAGGKTEAAYLPVLTKVASAPGAGIRVLNVSPLRALINDQHARVQAMGEYVDVPVHRWHGDVSDGEKKRVIKDPSGVLLITPESLEALFVLRGTAVATLFRHLDYVVIDELHAFIGTERGRQLQSLLHRVEVAAKKRIPRVAMSATLGDPSLAMDFLRPGAGDDVVYVSPDVPEREIKLGLRGYQRGADVPREERENVEPEDELAIADHLFKTLRGDKNLAFANSRRSVELYTARLRRMCESQNLPEEFFPHHGSLSREYREDSERMLKEAGRPATIFCTSTLELGIDVGAVKSVAQIGCPPGVASLRQRLGRSGRADGAPAILRMYITEDSTDSDAPVEDALRVELVQSIAIVRLLLRRWYEPPTSGMLHLSTLVQQVLSLIAQHGGASAAQAWRLLCETGPFRDVGTPMFARLLRVMAARDLIVQTHDGLLVLGLKGERLVNHYGFYAVFVTPEEWQLKAGGKPLGSLPISNPVTLDTFLIFAGRRWRVVGVDEESHVIDVVPSPGGRAPFFEGTPAPVHDGIRQEMLRVYREGELPRFLDPRATSLLLEGCEAFERLGLRETAFVAHRQGCTWFPWAGDRVMNTIVLAMKRHGVAVEPSPVTLRFPKASKRDVELLLRQLLEDDFVPADLVTDVRNLQRNKYDYVLDEGLLREDFASSDVDVVGMREVIGRNLP
ncbi:MAG: DEAD/DEAH box helicase [Myxococcota bacterium]